MPRTTPSAYCACPLVEVIRRASPVLRMLPISIIATGTSDMFSVPRSLRTFKPVPPPV